MTIRRVAVGRDLGTRLSGAGCSQEPAGRNGGTDAWGGGV